MIVGTQKPNFLCVFPFFMQHVGEVVTSKHTGYRHQSVKKTHLAASNKETM
jgi:hypothetical protein